MGSNSIYPEKVALYFSSMNPLSAKILADIQAVETSVINTDLTFSEKSKIIDQHLIYDVIQRHRAGNKNQSKAPTDSHVTEDDEGNQVFNDPELDKDHEQALLQSVYPKRPEKYIYDDNSMYSDEHSEPFNYCTQSQITYCDLEKLIKNPPKNRSIPNNIPFHFLSKSDSKSRLPPAGTPSSITGSGGEPRRSHSHREKKPAPPAPPHHNKGHQQALSKRFSSDYDSDHSSSNSFVADRKFVASSTESILDSPTQLSPRKGINAVPVFGVPIMGFPQSSSSTSITKPDKKYNNHTTNANHDESNLPQQVQNLDLIAELQAKLKLNNKAKPPQQQQQQAQSPSAGKVTKPKAPPPPPPGHAKKVPGSAVKVSEPSCPKPVSPQPETKQAGGKMPGSKEDDFTVDVSSPCKIATPKTGFDFLDNW